MTALNLFCAKIDIIVDKIRQATPKFVIIDTPGQIEAFTWSASGQMITECLACEFPTIISYITDSEKCSSPNTFMSNMLYSLSIMYKSRLPLIAAFNKIDIKEYSYAISWLTDFEEFEVFLKRNQLKKHKIIDQH